MHQVLTTQIFSTLLHFKCMAQAEHLQLSSEFSKMRFWESNCMYKITVLGNAANF